MESTGSWPSGRGPNICEVCFGWCCGPTPYKGGTWKHGCKEYREDHAMSDLKKAGNVAKVNSVFYLLFYYCYLFLDPE